MNRLVLIDGHALLHRAYHAYPPLTTSQGELVNAVYGFTSIMLAVLKKLKPGFVAVAFDKKGPTFRHKQFKDYKAHRPKIDKELEEQIEPVHQLVKTLNIPIFEVDGFEADDVIGTLSKQADLQEVVIVTGDKDALQLIDNKIKVFIPGRGRKPDKMFDRQAFLNKYGFEPRYLVDFKGLAGDASDGIPGIKGIGPKTAKELITAFGTVEEIFQAVDQSKFNSVLTNKQRLLELLKKGRKEAFLSKQLAEIVVDVPLNFKLKKCRLLDYDRQKVEELFAKLEFKSLVKKLPQKSWQEADQLVDEKGIKSGQKNNNKQMELF